MRGAVGMRVLRGWFLPGYILVEGGSEYEIVVDNEGYYGDDPKSII